MTLVPGEIAALVGENGAGKTTLARIAAGKLEPSAGEVVTRGAAGLVHQHFELVPRLRVWENVLLGIEPQRGAFLDTAAARSRVRALSEAYGLPVDPDANVEDLPVGIAQRVELLRELAREPAILILDEPTAVLAPAEIDALFATLSLLASRGTAILVITHKLNEVIAHTSAVTVLRAGVVVARFAAPLPGVEAIAEAMVGAGLPPLAERANVPRRPGLRVQNLSAGDGAHALANASFEVARGEIVGLAGIEGNGQTALADALCGVLSYRGTIEVAGTLLGAGGAGAHLAAGIRTIPQDRRTEGLVPTWSLVENAVLGEQHSQHLRRGVLLDARAERDVAQQIVERYDVRAASLETPAGALSGGNQQKLVVGRALEQKPEVLVAYQPTRGIDIAATSLVRSRLIEARNSGIAIVLISFELDELFEISDRILVLFRGAIVAAFPRSEFDRSRIGAAMAGLNA